MEVPNLGVITAFTRFLAIPERLMTQSSVLFLLCSSIIWPRQQRQFILRLFAKHLLICISVILLSTTVELLNNMIFTHLKYWKKSKFCQKYEPCKCHLEQNKMTRIAPYLFAYKVQLPKGLLPICKTAFKTRIGVYTQVLCKPRKLLRLKDDAVSMKQRPVQVCTDIRNFGRRVRICH